MKGWPGHDSVPLDDRGLAYGDGLFETVLVRDGQALLWDEHVARLARGCRALALPPPDMARLARLPARAGMGLKVLKIILTRGSGGRGYLPPDPSRPRLRWQVADFAPQPDRWRDGVRVRHCRLQLGRQPALAGIKHLNRLENVLARREWRDAEVAEGLLCDSAGQLVEATTMNLVWRRDGRLETPCLARCGVAGTLRDALMARQAIAQVSCGPEVLAEAEALWLLNSVQGVWPVARLDDAEGVELRRWCIDDAHRSLQAMAHELLGYPVAFER